MTRGEGDRRRSGRSFAGLVPHRFPIVRKSIQVAKEVTRDMVPRCRKRTALEGRFRGPLEVAVML